jgi:hypothetical protein
MNLKDFRTQFIKLSGRYDLVLDAVDYVDNGANFYINGAVKMLDRLITLPSSKARINYPMILITDEDSNFWLTHEADLLMRATLYKLETFSRGTENSKTWLKTITDDAILIDMDLATEESNGVTQTNG